MEKSTEDDYATANDNYWKLLAKASGLPYVNPDKVLDTNEEKAYELHQKGVSMKDIAWKLNTSVYTVKRWLTKAAENHPLEGPDSPQEGTEASG